MIIKNVTWESSNSAAVKLTSFGDYGEANAMSPGTAQVTAKLGETVISAADTLVTDAVLKSMVIYPSKVEFPFPDPVQFSTLTGSFDDGFMHDITNVASWEPTIARVTGFGLGSLARPSEPRGSHRDRGCDRHPGSPTSLEISGARLDFNVGNFGGVRATVRYAGGETLDVTNIVNWHSNDPGIAAFKNASNPGQITGIRAG